MNVRTDERPGEGLSRRLAGANIRRMRDFTEIGRNPLRCLWLTRMDPVAADAGDLVYSLHLLTSLSRAGVALTVLAMGRIGDRARSNDADGIEWVILPWESGLEIGGHA